MEIPVFVYNIQQIYLFLPVKMAKFRRCTLGMTRTLFWVISPLKHSTLVYKSWWSWGDLNPRPKWQITWFSTCLVFWFFLSLDCQKTNYQMTSLVNFANGPKAATRFAILLTEVCLGPQAALKKLATSS